MHLPSVSPVHGITADGILKLPERAIDQTQRTEDGKNPRTARHCEGSAAVPVMHCTMLSFIPTLFTAHKRLQSASARSGAEKGCVEERHARAHAHSCVTLDIPGDESIGKQFLASR